MLRNTHNLQRFFNPILDGYDWHCTDEAEREEDEKMLYPNDLPLNHWRNKKLEQMNEFRCYLDGAGIGIDIYSTDDEVQMLINNLLNYFDININDNIHDEDKQYKAKTVKELFKKEKCKKAITQINKWLAE